MYRDSSGKCSIEGLITEDHIDHISPRAGNVPGSSLPPPAATCYHLLHMPFRKVNFILKKKKKTLKNKRMPISSLLGKPV